MSGLKKQHRSGDYGPENAYFGWKRMPKPVRVARASIAVLYKPRAISRNCGGTRDLYEKKKRYDGLELVAGRARKILVLHLAFQPLEEAQNTSVYALLLRGYSTPTCHVVMRLRVCEPHGALRFTR